MRLHFDYFYNNQKPSFLEQTKNLIANKKPDLIINAAAKVGGIQANNTQRTDFIMENLKIIMNGS